MQGLRERGLIEPVIRYASSGRPLLGICLGMQMLATESEEFGRHAGLNLIPEGCGHPTRGRVWEKAESAFHRLVAAYWDA